MAFAGQPLPQAFGPRPAGMSATRMAEGSPFDNGSALAVAPIPNLPKAGRSETPPELATVGAPSSADAASALDVDAIREAVLHAMEVGGSQMLVQALEEGNWSGEGNTVSVQVEMSEAMIGVSYTREQERLAGQAASKVAGRAVKVRLVGGAPAALQTKPRASGAERAASGSLKTRAADEPVVKRMMEKFGAEIRIVMDRSER